MSDHLNEFYAVTQTSLYLVQSEDKEEGAPSLTKVAMREGAISKVPVGRRVFGWDKPFFRIRGNYLQLCCGWDDSHHSATTPSRLVALFLDETEALACLQVKDAQILDTRWREQTQRVLKAIGDDHPIFNVWWEDFPPEYLKQSEE